MIFASLPSNYFRVLRIKAQLYYLLTFKSCRLKTIKYIVVILAILALYSCKVPSYFQNSVNTPCFNDENKYQITAGYSNRNYIAQLAANPYKGISILANSGFSNKQNNNDISVGYNFYNFFIEGLGVEAFLGYGLGETNYRATQTYWNFPFPGTENYTGHISNKFEKYISQLDIYFIGQDNVQLCVFGRYSHLNFKTFHSAFYYDYSPGIIYEKNYTNFSTGVFDVGLTFKYQIKHFGFFLQGSYTNHTSPISLPPNTRFQKHMPAFFGAGLTFYWKGFKESNKATN